MVSSTQAESSGEAMSGSAVGRDVIAERLRQIDSLLYETRWLWQPQPFKEERPAWCAALPQLCETLLALGDEEVACLGQDYEALITLLAGELPQLAQLHRLCQLPACPALPLQDQGPHFQVGIPGRKWQQIVAFAAALGRVNQPILEWCGGKGHLGRLLGRQWQQPVDTVEHNALLCTEGEQLAQRTRVVQHFYRLDAYSSEAGKQIAGRHPLALHACGELHRTLVRHAVAAGVTAFDIAPCCYYLGAAQQYQPFSDALQLSLNRDDLRLAVTETVTAAGREVVRRDQEMAWKLGYDRLRREACGVEGYLPIKPIDKAWLRLDFEGFCRELARREERALPCHIAWSRYEQSGWQRQREVMRLSLLRAAFRRALEMWLVLDMANYIAASGYTVSLGTFCARELTPRNILLSARR